MGFASRSHVMATIAGQTDELLDSMMEKKSAIDEKGKVSNQHHNHTHIPDDLAYFILSKLNPKSFKRFGCVCKSWGLLSENPNFMSMYRNYFISNNHSYYDDTSLLLVSTTTPIVPSEPIRTGLYLLSGEGFENRVKLDLPPPFQERDNYILVCGSVNGTLCLQRATKIVLWNLTTGEFKVIPPSPVESVPPYRGLLPIPYGFGYDHVSDDYKVIRFVQFSPLYFEEPGRLSVPPEEMPLEDISFNPWWEIYSLRSNSWRKLDVDRPICYSGLSAAPGVYMSGVCHWLGGTDTNDVEECLVSFDLSNEVFFTTPTPSDIDDTRVFRNSTNDSFNSEWKVRKLVVLNGSIAFVSYYAPDRTTFHISILGELGVKESWTKLFVVGPLPCHHYPIGAGKKGDICFIKKDGQLVLFDLSTQMIKELGVIEEDCAWQILIYRKSLLSIGGINN